MPSATPQPAPLQPDGGTTRRPTSLLSLPDELLDDICERLDFSQAAELMPTCKRLLPILRRYACVQDFTIWRELELHALSRDSRWIGRYVTNFYITLDWEYSSGQGHWDRSPEEVALIGPPLLRIIERVPNVSNLTVYDLPYDTCKLLVEALAEDGCLKKVCDLDIDKVTDDGHVEALPWQCVPSSSCLTTLRVDDIDYFTTYENDDSTAVTELPSIRRLELSLAFHPNGKYPCKFIISLPNLKELVLTDDWNLTIRGAALLLREPGIPSTLESLEIFCSDQSDYLDVNPPVEAVLPRFSELKKLRLGKGHFTRAGLPRCLESLPCLSWLSFGKGADVDVQFCYELEDGPNAPPDLYAYEPDWSDM